jgi:hypothetical protein
MKIRSRQGIMLLTVIGVIAALALPGRAQGHWEFGFHYSRWSIDLIRGVIKDGIGEAIETELRDEILAEIQNDYPTLTDIDYSQSLEFDSSGDNFGFEARWYPGGLGGSFSLGLSVEKTSMKVALPSIAAAMGLRDRVTSQTGDFQAAAGGEFLLKPLSFHLSLRWDILPSSSVHPYITFGFGAATGTALEDASVTYYYSGDLAVPGYPMEHYEDSFRKSIKELRDELEEEGEDFFLPAFIPFIQLNLGLKAALSPNIHLLVDAGIWNGFLLRGGIAFRI